MRVILVDDEPIALELLKLMLSSYEDIEIAGAYMDPLEALKNIDKTKPEVIFLDIEMGSMSGLELASAFLDNQINVEIVFVTAYSQYAIDAFELNAIDYLQKPVQENRMKKTIERLRNKINTPASTIMGDLKLRCFGDLQILDSCDKPLTWRTQKTKELFVYLWYKGEAVSKSLIMDDIFPDKDLEKVGTLLHTTIYQLRKSLEKLGFSKGIEHSNDSYRLNVPIKSDNSELNCILEKKDYSEEDIDKILKIYNGDFLEKEEYFWAMEHRQKYTQKVSEILERYAAKWLRHDEFPQMIKLLLEKLLKLDPYNENAAKINIIYYGKTGNRAELEKFYKNFEKTLLEELEVEPEEATVILYKKYMRK